MMAQQVAPQPTESKRRVKVYELRNGDWFDRGTGFCTTAYGETRDDQQTDPRVIVESEENPERMLLETRVVKEDGFQKQQETLIVWTEPSNGMEMALSFQEPEGCAAIWGFVSNIQASMQNVQGADDSLSDELNMEVPSTITLPIPQLSKLAEIEATMRDISTTANGRDALAKFILNEDYINKLIPLVTEAEDLEGIDELHLLCNIMKTIILLNDTGIIEHVVSDDCVLGVVGALEYDPDFPSHKANHRQWLDNQRRFKEVVPIGDEQIKRKIHHTFRLQYLKDVVLARILDDPTFSVLNSMIFFNQVDILQHLQGNAGFLVDLFGIFKSPAADQKQRKDAVLFIQQCCAIAKNIQPPSRQTLYNNFLGHGLMTVIHFGLRHSDVGVRVGATDILVSMIDHDPQMIRATIYRQQTDQQPLLTDSLIDLLLVEVDLGIKSQICDALRVLLESPAQVPMPENLRSNGEYQSRMKQADTNHELFLGHFYDKSAPRLFRPLIDLEGRKDLDFTVQQASMFSYLIDIICFFIRQHQTRGKYFIMQHNLAQRIAQLLNSPEKYLRLVAIRFIRHLISIQDAFYIKHLTDSHVLGPVLESLAHAMPRDNLLTSAALDLFEYVRKENIKDVVKHLVQNYREILQSLSYIDTFRDLLLRYDQTRGYTSNMEFYLEAEDEVGRRLTNTNPRMMDHMAVDTDEDTYWNTSDDEEEQAKTDKAATTNGQTSTPKPLVDYPSDEEGDENADPGASSAIQDGDEKDLSMDEEKSVTAVPPPERISEKRRREEEEEDAIGALVHEKKRRNSTSVGPNVSAGPVSMRQRRSSSTGSRGSNHKRISINLSPALKAEAGSGGEDGG